MTKLNLKQIIIYGIAVFVFAFVSIALVPLTTHDESQYMVSFFEEADESRDLIPEVRREVTTPRFHTPALQLGRPALVLAKTMTIDETSQPIDWMTETIAASYIFMLPPPHGTAIYSVPGNTIPLTEFNTKQTCPLSTERT